jgi:transcription elongation factor Elf1
MSVKNDEKKIAFTCPVCGKTTDRPLDELKEGALITCPFCQLKLTLHGHMLQEIKERIEDL